AAVSVEVTLLRRSIKPVLAETSKQLFDGFRMLIEIVGDNQDVVEVYDNRDVGHRGQDVVHKTLKSGQRVSVSKRHNQLIERAIASSKSSLPLVPIRNAHKVVGVLQVDLGIDFGTSWGCKKVRDEG